MAVFRGVYPAPDLVPSPVGILNVARVMRHTARDYDERWVRGFSFEYDSNPTVRILTTNDDVVTDGELNDGSFGVTYEDYAPFFIEVENLSSQALSLVINGTEITVEAQASEIVKG